MPRNRITLALRTAAALSVLASAIAIAQPNGAELGEIARLIDAGKIKPHVDAVYGLDDVRAAQERLEDGHVRGKVVIEVAGAAA